MKYLRTVGGCTKVNQLRNEDIGNELRIPTLYETITIQKQKEYASAKDERDLNLTTSLQIPPVR
jgi:hypothetical protein